MGSFFDKLQDEMGKRDEETKKGFSPLDLVDLDPPLRKLMRMMIRKTKLTYLEIIDVVKGEDDDFDQEDLNNTLANLVKRDWLIQLGEGERSTYKVNLGRRRASGLDESVWSSINKKIEERIQEQTEKKSEDPEE